MQEVRYDGSELLTPNVTDDMIARALANPENVTVAVHKPGAVFKGQGHTYRVSDTGALEIQKDKRRAARRRQKRARRAGRR